MIVFNSTQRFAIDDSPTMTVSAMVDSERPGFIICDKLKQNFDIIDGQVKFVGGPEKKVRLTYSLSPIFPQTNLIYSTEDHPFKVTAINDNTN